MMTRASSSHVTITMNIAFALRQSLRGTQCRQFASDAKVLAGGSVRYSDIAVSYKPFGGSDDVVPEPVLIIEVVSPTTEREDRGRKKFDYFATALSNNTQLSSRMRVGSLHSRWS
jgi:Uma2 family endonuclease